MSPEFPTCQDCGERYRVYSWACEVHGEDRIECIGGETPYCRDCDQAPAANTFAARCDCNDAEHEQE